MISFSVPKTLARLIGCAGLLGLLTAATCEGEGFVQVEGDLPPGHCILENPVNNPNPAAGTAGDVLQLADAANVNDFIQCNVLVVFESGSSVNVVVDVSAQDAQGHGFVGSGRPAKIFNLSR